MNPIIKYFRHDHLPSPLKDVSAPLGDVAMKMDSFLPDCAEKTAGLRKLLEAKDCFVRAALDAQPALERQYLARDQDSQPLVGPPATVVD